VLDGTARKKELKRAKQAGQQRASGSDCNLAVNRTLTTNLVTVKRRQFSSSFCNHRHFTRVRRRRI